MVVTCIPSGTHKRQQRSKRLMTRLCWIHAYSFYDLAIVTMFRSIIQLSGKQPFTRIERSNEREKNLNSQFSPLGGAPKYNLGA